MQINLAWTSHSTNEAGFHVYRSVDGAPSAVLHDVGAGVVTDVDTDVAEGHTYLYSVTAFNSAGESAHSNDVTVTIPVTVVVPDAPSDLTATLA